MRAIALAVIGVLAASSQIAAPAFASDQTDVMAAVKKWTADYNKGDMKAFEAGCAPQAVIIDETSPYVWQGASACSDWVAALDANNKKNGSTDGIVTYGKPLHIEVTGDHAYVVLPAKYTDKEKGKKVTQSATWAATMQKTALGWSITGSAWSEH